MRPGPAGAQASGAPEPGGLEVLAALGREVPALRQRQSEILARLALQLEPALCMWQVDALAGALESLYASLSRIDPDLLAYRSFLGLIRVAPTEAARSAFQQSVMESTSHTDTLFAELDSLVGRRSRETATVRRLLVDLILEIGVTHKAQTRWSARLADLEQDLRARADATITPASRSACGILLHKSASARQQLADLEQLHAAASHLHAACERALSVSERLAKTVRARVAASWQALAASLQALEYKRHPLSLPDRRARVREAQDELQAWLEQAREECAELQEATKTAQGWMLRIRKAQDRIASSPLAAITVPVG